MRHLPQGRHARRSTLPRPTVSSDAPNYKVGDTITATIANSTGSPEFAVGLYYAGQNVRVEEPVGGWFYCDGTQVLPGAGDTDYELQFDTTGLIDGLYALALISDAPGNPLTEIARSQIPVQPWSFEGPQAEPVSVSYYQNTGPWTIDLDVAALLSYSGTPTFAVDPSSDSGFSFADENVAELTVANVASGPDFLSALINLTDDDGEVQFRVDVEIRVASIVADATSYGIGTIITATVTNGPGIATDQVGLWLEADDPTADAPEQWVYLASGDQVLPSSGKINGSVTFPTTGESAGSYTLALFRDLTEYMFDDGTAFDDGTLWS